MSDNIKDVNKVINKHINCNGNQLKLCSYDCDYCFNRSLASRKISIIFSKDNEIQQRNILIGSDKMFKFSCDICEHEFYRKISSVTRPNYKCPYCSNCVLCADNDCNSCYNKSFSSHPKNNCWSGKNLVSSRDIFKNSPTKYYFDCDKCYHEFRLRLCDVCDDRFCPFCGNRKLCDDYNCEFCSDKSLKSHPIAKLLSTKNNMDARDIFKNSHKTCIFECDKCHHEFIAQPNKIITWKTFCPYCCPISRKLCDDVSCEICLQKSFESVVTDLIWSKENKTDKRQIAKGSKQVIILECNICKNKFSTSPCYVIKGSGCPHCINKTETKLLKHIESIYGSLTIIRQAKFDWCKNNNHLPLDFLIKELNIIIELDGLQHFEQVSNWQSPELTRKQDIYKMKLALKNDYTIIRILQDDVWNDKNNWKQILTLHIKFYTKPTIIYICSNNEYACYDLNEDDINDTNTKKLT